MAQLSQLLLFDPDPSGLDTLSYGFEKDGCSVTATSDAAKARDLIQSANPPLVLVNFRENERVGLDLLRAVSSSPRTRNVPCVAIGREESRAAALAAGAFVFLSVPLFVRDVLGACRLVVAASVPGSRPSPDTELSLTLPDIDGVYFLIRSMTVTARSTAVEFHRGLRRGELRFIDGTLTSAQFGAIQGLPALHQMLLWQSATLKFRFKNVVRRGSQLSMKSNEVIEECDRFLRDFVHEVKDIGHVQSVYRSKTAGKPAPSTLPSEILPVLKLFDGQAALGQVLEASPFRVFDTLKIIKRLVLSEAIDLVTAPPAIVPELGPSLSGPAALDFWFQRQPSTLGLGAEVGVARQAEALRTAAKQAAASVPPVGGRASSPFGAVAAGMAAGSGVPALRANPKMRPRTPTKKNVVEPTTPPHDAAEDMVTPPPIVTPPPVAKYTAVPVAALPVTATRWEAVPERAAAPAPIAETAPQQIALKPAASPPQDPGVTPPKPAAGVATGEIRAIRPSRQTGSVPVAGAPSVLVDIAPLPAPVAMDSPEPPPVSAQASPPSVIIAPLDPAPAPAPAPAPRARKPTPGAVEARTNRLPSDNFNALEADFFEREADLYKGESVENFDDLDKGHPRTPGGGPRRKR